MENKSVDLEGAAIDTAPVKASTTKVVDKPLGVMDAVAPAADADLTAALGGEGTPAESEAKTKPAGEGATVDESISALIRATIEDPDLHLNQVMLGQRNVEYLESKLRKLYPTDDEQKEAKENLLSMFNLMLRAFRDGWGSNSMSSYMAVLEQKLANDKSPVDTLVDSKDKEKTTLGDGVMYNMKTSGVDLVDDEARDAFMSKISGLKRVKLLNSGFWVTLRRPLIHELQDIYDSVDMEQREIGYSIGPHFALVADIYIKRRFIESLVKYRIIRDSNLENIYKGDTFMSAVSFHDYDTLLAAVLSLMSRKGLRARVICPECFKATILDKVDIDSAKYFNQDLITPEMMAWWDAKTDINGKPIGKRTLKDLKHYRDDILKFNHEYVHDFDGAKIKLVYGVPTMKDYFDIGELLVARIRDVINEKSVGDEDRRQVMMAVLAAHTIHMVSPWIKTIENMDGDQVTMRTTDRGAILDTLDLITQDSDDKPIEELNKFLAMSKIAYIGTFALECPYCHARPDVGKNQFYPLEVQTIFFGQLFRLFPVELIPQGR